MLLTKPLAKVYQQILDLTMGADLQLLGTQFTCYTGTKVQILTQKARRRVARLLAPLMLTYADLF
jgi:hypothetical protein